MALLMAPRLLCYLQCIILVLISGDLSHSPVYVKWFQSLEWWLFLKVVPGRLNGPPATLPGTSGMFLSGDVSFLVRSALTISHSSSHVHKALRKWRALWEAWLTGEMTDEDLWYGSMPLALWQKAIKLCLDSGKVGKRCLMIDSGFSDNAHTTMQPESVMTKTLL